MRVMPTLEPIASLVAGLVIFLVVPRMLGREERHQGTASWYSAASAREEGSSGIMANGRPMDDRAFTAASWDFPLGSSVIVQCQEHCAGPDRAVHVTITDRGPAKRLYAEGRIIDLSPIAFRALAPLRQGIIGVHVESTLPSSEGLP